MVAPVVPAIVRPAVPAAYDRGAAVLVGMLSVAFVVAVAGAVVALAVPGNRGGWLLLAAALTAAQAA